METKSYRILVINPGSTSDEVSYFEGDTEIFHKTVRYSPKDFARFEALPVSAQFEFRSELVQKVLDEAQVDITKFDAIVGRGGLLRPVPSGTFQVNEEILQVLKDGKYGDHPSNLGGMIAYSIATKLGIPAFIADPVVVDEMDSIARYSGMPDNPRVSIFHALNQKRVARLAANELKKPYEACDLIVMHGGGGISVGAHHKGRVVDVNNALDGEGPFTPQRSGGVPAGGWMRLIQTNRFSVSDLKLKIKGRGGLVAYTGTCDLYALEKYLNGEPCSAAELENIKPGLTKEYISECIEAMSYQISKEICALMAYFKGKVDAIVLTGGIVKDKRILNWIKDRVGWIAPILVYPGGDEMRALKDAATRVLDGTPPQYYKE